MTRYLFVAALLLIITGLSGCGKGPIESGDEAFQRQNYSEAIKYYLEAAKELKNDDMLKEKIATTYFQEGELFYEKRHVIKAFEARVRMGMQYVPENPSTTMKRTVSNVYLKLAQAYRNARPENPYQQRKYFDQALKNIEKSLTHDSTNSAAVEALNQFREEHFQSLLEKGMASYKKAARDPLQYIAADHYLTNALKLDPENAEAKRYRTLARKKSLNLLDPGMDVPIAVTDQMKNEEYTAFLVVTYNLLPEPLYVSAGHFVLVKENGEEVYGKTSGMFSTPLEGKTIANGSETAGVVAFPSSGNNTFARLEFRKDGEVLGYKNLP
ncbi:MAG: hypothetical protein EH225_08895 [Calditrichaeota bacterium]|nr:hypothetical protein [Calditrichota bacterium]RQW02162.1 MAG: hypothetical protein EH225_08895 [Calditrichota bacterium]